jgi:hypothetical protein
MVSEEAESLKPHWTPRDWIAAAALFAATAGVVLWQNAHVAALFDLSYILNTAERIALGQVPYRDFPLAHAPLTFLVQAAIIRLTGRVVFHHVLYVATVGGLGTVLAWRIALNTLRGRAAYAWALALLLAAPLVFLGVYCIVPNPEYDCDCGFWLLVAFWMLQRIASEPHPSGEDKDAARVLSGKSTTQCGCHLERRSPQRPESKDPRLFFNGFRTHLPWTKPPKLFLRGFAAGAVACVPLFFKQNMGLPFLLAAVCAVAAVLALKFFKRGKDSFACQSSRALLGFLAGVGAALAAALLALEATAGLGNFFHWTVQYAGQRRLPGLSLMLGVYSDPTLAYMLLCVAVALVLLRMPVRVCFKIYRLAGAALPQGLKPLVLEPFSARLKSCPDTKRVQSGVFPQPVKSCPDTRQDFETLSSKFLGARIAAFVLLAAPFVYTLASLAIYDDADSRGDSLLLLWPLFLVLAAALALANLFGLRRELSLRAFFPLVVLAAIHGTFLSQQLWGSTYGIWPLLVLLVAELVADLEGFGARGSLSRWFVPALAALISITLLVCGGLYMASEERLDYANLPDGPPEHSAFTALAGLATPGPYVPEIDELVRYAQANIPFDDGVLLIPGEEPFYFATGRAPRFPVPFFDPTIDPYSPAEIAALARKLNIRWLIVKRDVQTKEDPTPDRAALLQLLMRQFTPVAHLRGYDVYLRQNGN